MGIRNALSLILIPLIASCNSGKPLNFGIPDALLESALKSPPNVSWSETAVEASEASGAVEISLRLSAPSPLTVSAPISVSGTLPGFTGTTAQFKPGSTSTTIRVPIPQDSDINSSSPRTISLQIGLPQYATQGLPASIDLRIVDDDRPIVRFSAVDLDASENQGSLTLTAVSDRPFSGGSPVNISAQTGGSAVLGTDYTLSSQNFVFNPGSTSASITMNLINNGSIGNLKNAVLTLSRSSSSVFNLHPTLARSQVIIRDDDGPLRIGFGPMAQGTVADSGTSFSISLTEGSGNLQIPVVLSRPAPTSVSAPITIASNPSAIPGTDFMLFTQQVTVQAGQVRGTVSVSLIDNMSFKGNRSFALLLGTPNNGASLTGITRMNISITENDSPPSIEFESYLISKNEDAGLVEIPVSLSSLSTSSVSASASIGSNASGSMLLGDAIQGEDFSVNSSSVSIPAGSSRGAFRITLINDTVNEDTESVIATLSGGSAAGGASVPALGRTRTQVDILDNDPNVTIQWDLASQAVDESTGRALVSASLNQPAGKNVHVPFSIGGNAILGTHHELTPSELIIPKGSTQATLEIPLINDPNVDADHVLTLTFGNSGNALIGSRAVHTLTITDSSGFTPSITAFQTTVWTFVKGQACYSCHKPGGPAEFAPFASDNLQDAFNAAVPRANFTTIPSSLLVTKLQSASHQQFSNLTQNMITQITNWKNQSQGSTTGSGGTTGSATTGGGSPLSDGSVGIQDFLQIEATFSSASQIAPPSLNSGGTYPILRANISADGDPLGISAPMAGAYIGLGAHYCKAMIDEVAGSNPNKRGFNLISGLNNFNVTASGFTPVMQVAVARKLSEMFWHRLPTSAEETELLSLVSDLRASNSTLTTRNLGTALCSAIAGSVESIDN